MAEIEPGTSWTGLDHPLKIFDAAKKDGRLVYACAPMVRYSKLAFRQTVHYYNTNLCWTPMILAKEFNRNNFARDSDLTLSTTGPQPPTIVQFGANSPLELSRASRLVAPFVNGVDLNCGCPQSWACAEVLGAALMEKRELVRDMVTATRGALRKDGWGVGLENDMHHPEGKGRSVSVKIRVHKDLRKTVDFIETVIGDRTQRNIDWLTIHPRTRSTPSSVPIFTDALEILVDKYGDVLPVMLSGDVFDLAHLPFRTPYIDESTFGDEVTNEDDTRPLLPKLAGVMSARGLLANPALYTGGSRCSWDVVETFMNHIVRAPLPFKLVQHHISEMVSPGMGPDKRALLNKGERAELQKCTNTLDLIDFLAEKMEEKTGQDMKRYPT